MKCEQPRIIGSAAPKKKMMSKGSSYSRGGFRGMMSSGE